MTGPPQPQEFMTGPPQPQGFMIGPQPQGFRNGPPQPQGFTTRPPQGSIIGPLLELMTGLVHELIKGPVTVRMHCALVI